MWIIWLVLGLVLTPVGIEASGYVTVVNPIRGRELWKSDTIKTIDDQYQIVKEIRATWLVQYDVLGDKDLVEYLKSWGKNQELGIFLEISRQLADVARVPMEINRPWYDPGIVFLSGYSRSERKKLIDKLFEDFRETFGDYPKSVGAWWIDSYNLRYMEEKYGIKIAMIVADQKITDSYGVWGQWWSVPYRASEVNPQMPKVNGLPIIQWAMRDPEKAYFGEGYQVSNFSLQANDYLAQGLDINYFKNLAKTYLTGGGVRQITVGLEVGQEAVGNLGELKKQIDWLKEEKVEFVTMSQFGQKLGEVKIAEVGGWKMSLEGRENKVLGEKISYPKNVAWADEFVADKNSFLDRNLNNLKNKNISYLPYWIGAMVVVGIGVGTKWGWTKAMIGIMMSLLLWWPIFRSMGQWGWWVYYGPRIDNLALVQMLLAGVGVMVLSRVKIEAILVMGLLTIVNYARVTVIEDKIHAGFLSGFKLIGWNTREFEGWVVNSMLKFKWEWVWERWWLWLIVYPVIMIALGKIIDKLPTKMRLGVRIVLTVLLVVYIKDLWLADPIMVEAMR